MKIIIGILIFVVIVVLIGCISSMEERIARDEVTKYGYTINKIELHTFDAGPYWATKNTYIFRIEATKDGEYKILWTRHGLFMSDIYEEIGEREYREIQ